MLTVKEVRALIASNVIHSRELRAEANALKGIARHRIHLDRRTLGDETRCYLLLLAYLRGRPYRSVERHCANAPSTHRMAQILERATDPTIKWESADYARVRATCDAIEAWVNVPAETVTAVAA